MWRWALYAVLLTLVTMNSLVNKGWWAGAIFGVVAGWVVFEIATAVATRNYRNRERRKV